MRSRYTLDLQQGAVIVPFPFLQEAARCQLSASSSTSRSGPTSNVCADTLVRGLLGGRKLRFLVFPPSLVWRTQNRTGLVCLRTILGLDCEKMTVGWTYGRFMVASSPRTSWFGFGLVICLLPLLVPSCFVLPGFALGLVLPMGNQLVYSFGDAGCGLVTRCQN